MSDAEIAACPCGEIPERLYIVEQFSVFAMAAGACCGKWHIAFRRQNCSLGSPELNALALAAWNAAKRRPGI